MSHGLLGHWTSAHVSPGSRAVRFLLLWSAHAFFWAKYVSFMYFPQGWAGQRAILAPMTLDEYQIMPVGKLDKIDLGFKHSFGLSILICAAEESEARKLDDALTELLIEYDYDVLSGRREFRGTFFINYKSSKTPELQRDFEIFWGSDSRSQPGAQLPQEKPEKWKKLKDVVSFPHTPGNQ